MDSDKLPNVSTNFNYIFVMTRFPSTKEQLVVMRPLHAWLIPGWFHEASLSWITGQTNCNSETPRKEKSQKHHLQQRYQVHWASDSPPRLGVLGMSDYKKA